MADSNRRQLEFYREPDGSLPVADWLNSLPFEVRVKIAALIEKLAEHGATLDFPYSSQIEGKLRELRLRLGKTRYRILYFFDAKQAGILLHGFMKSSAAVPESEKAVGLRRMQIHIQRVAKRGGR